MATEKFKFSTLAVTLATGVPGGVTLENPAAAAGFGMDIKRVEVYLPPVSMKAVSADAALWAQVQAQVNDGAAGYATKGLTDDDLLVEVGLVNALTTSGEVLLVNPFIWEPPVPMVITHPYLAVFGSQDLVASLAVTVRVWYETVKVSEVEFLRLAQ